jgi:hypothetical protein
VEQGRVQKTKICGKGTKQRAPEKPESIERSCVGAREVPVFQGPDGFSFHFRQFWFIFGTGFCSDAIPTATLTHTLVTIVL